MHSCATVVVVLDALPKTVKVDGVKLDESYLMPAHAVVFTAKWSYNGWKDETDGTTYLVNDEKVPSAQFVITEEMLKEGVKIRKGKKVFHKAILA